MEPPNHGDFAPTKFNIYGHCEACSHSKVVEHAGRDMTVPRLLSRLRCRECGCRECSIRIVYTAIGD